MKNKEATRYFSNQHEISICKALGGIQTSNSGANKFEKGDIIIKDASCLVEAKCSMKEKTSFSIKEEWLSKNREEAFRNRLNNRAICFNFKPNGNNYYVIDESLMQFLIEKLKENN